MPRLLSVLVAIGVAGVGAHGSGAWQDPAHTIEGKAQAGMRYVSETTHKLTMVGTDDGEAWWSLQGWCTGDDMTNIHVRAAPAPRICALTVPLVQPPAPPTPRPPPRSLISAPRAAPRT